VCRRGRAHLVESILAGHYQRPVDPQSRQRARHALQVAGVGDADQLAPRAGRVGQRAEEVEDRPHRQLAAHRDHEARGLMMRRGEHEAEAGLVDAAGDRVGAEVDARAHRLEHVGAAGEPGGRAVAVLGQRAARAGGDQGGGGRDVEGRAPAAGAGGVEQVVAPAGHGRGQRAHGARQARELLDGLALGAQRDEEGRDLGLGGVAGHDLGEDRGGLLLGEVVAGRERVDGPGERVVRH
jgi:hypothetical protein